MPNSDVTCNIFRKSEFVIRNFFLFVNRSNRRFLTTIVTTNYEKSATLSKIIPIILLFDS